ncbi:hypothetical protein ACHAXA_005864 [Cyclostephanos tholiformis]|uniref:Uncharacterized protein n=1 Tax=Cyclostephanos tholiformis TaxID=382380 RepID=A0ABD3RCX3_9STRA
MILRRLLIFHRLAYAITTSMTFSAATSHQLRSSCSATFTHVGIGQQSLPGPPPLASKGNSPIFRVGCRRNGTRFFASMPPIGDDLLKWERMYHASTHLDEKIEATIESVPGNFYEDQTSTAALGSIRSEIRVVSFDLDDTIWKTATTISDANDALANYLYEAFGIEERSEKLMGQLFKQHPDRYAGIDFLRMDSAQEVACEVLTDNENFAEIVQNVGRSDINIPTDATTDGGGGVHIQTSFGLGGGVKKKPVFLTLLRKDAIRSMLIANNDKAGLTSPPIDLEYQVDLAFEVWMEARCQSISNNFAPCAVSTLRNLRSQLAHDSSKNVYFCAITDGNSNPNRLSELSSIFDFVIKAEDVGASKPDKRIFKAAVATLILKLANDGENIEEFFLGEKVEDGVATSAFIKKDSTSTTLSWRDIEEEAVDAFSDAVGPWWVHVGDDFFKDVVAAKEFKMRTVWSREFLRKLNDTVDSSAEKKSIGRSLEKEPRTVSDLMSDVANSNGVIKMSVGESDFLRESLHEEFCDAILDRFNDLGDLLMSWHKEGKAGRISNGIAGEICPETKAGMWNEVQQQLDEEFLSMSSSKSAYKFCVFCGVKLPTTAKFCSNCGEIQ